MYILSIVCNKRQSNLSKELFHIRQITLKTGYAYTAKPLLGNLCPGQSSLHHNHQTLHIMKLAHNKVTTASFLTSLFCPICVVTKDRLYCMQSTHRVEFCFEWPPKLSMENYCQRQVTIQSILMTLLTTRCLPLLPLIQNDYRYQGYSVDIELK